MIPYGRQEISQADIDAVVAVLRSDWLTQGPLVPRFESAIAAYCGAGHGVALNSATSALHVACLGLGLGPGDTLWTTPNTFVASANCALYCGAGIDFVDIDPDTYNLSVEALADKLETADRCGTLPKIVVPVHFAGQPCDMRAIRALADRYGFRIVEDASHAIGGEYAGGKIGNGHHAEATIFSYHPVKIITTAEGGMIMTNSAELADRMSRLRSHGITRDPSQMAGESDGAWYYQQIELGFNYRMTEMQAALGLSQLERLDAFVMRRRLLADRYDRLLAGLPVRVPYRDPAAASAWHLYAIQLELGQIGKTRRAVFDAMRAQGIGVNVHYIPVHTQPYYRQLGFRPGDYPNAERYYAAALSLPLYPGLSEADQEHVVACLASALK